MDIRVSPRRVEPFRAPKKSLGDVDADAMSRLITATADIALVIDAKGVIRDLAVGSEELSRDGLSDWVGQRWLDTVTEESRAKVGELLAEAAAKSTPRWRQVNHPVARGPDLPIRYSAVQIGEAGRIVAVGRDLRGIAVLQQRLVDAQQTMEREYARLRHAETRYRLLFQISSEAVIVVDGTTQRIVEANPAATRLTGKSGKKLAGKALPELFDDAGHDSVAGHLASVRAAGRADEIRVRLEAGRLEVVLQASLFRQDNTAHFLVRLSPIAAGAATYLNQRSSLFEVVQKLPDGFVVTDTERRILTANQAFVELAQLASEEQVRGEPLDRWVGRHAVDVDVLVKGLRERGEIRSFATIVRGEYGSLEDVEVSGVAVASGSHPCFGLTFRTASRRPSFEIALGGRRTTPRSVEQLTELVGRVPLKELVRESTDMIERLCIEAALELTDDNRASAAEMLGLSRQGLYSKLRRHGLGDLEPGEGE